VDQLAGADLRLGDTVTGGLIQAGEGDVMADPMARQAELFCEASIRDRTGRAAEMLAASPELAGYDLATAVILGDAGRVRAELARDPGLATRVDPRTGWTPLHAACASQWHRLDPGRAAGLLAVAGLLLDAGADPNGHAAGRPGRGRGWTPLRCAVAGTANPEMVGLLLERGAAPDDHDLYLAGFGDDDHQSLRLLLRHAPDVPVLAEMALAAPVSLGDTEGVRLLLAAGADPRRYADDDAEPASAAYEAVRSGCPAELLDLLLSHGADPGRPGRDGRSPRTLAVVGGRGDLAEVLNRYGAADDATDADRFLAGCQRADRAAVADLLARGADLEARDATWDSTPLDWACVGSGERPAASSHPDWLATAQALLEAGASLEGITLAPDDPKPPSPEVGALLRAITGR
jgi:ankyrin repeat protein